MIYIILLSILICILITFQDFKERQVLVLLFPVLGALVFALNYFNSVSVNLLFVQIAINLILISSILLILYIYTKLIKKQKFLNHSLGLGDIFFFFIMAIGFPTVTFSVLFVCSMVFSLVVYLFIKNKLSQKTVPLAGLMSLFMALIFGVSLLKGVPNLYRF